jgi:hypothetical protein
MSGTPVPKGSSVALDDAALLDLPSCIGPVCVVTGLPADAKHHHPFRSSIPKDQQHRIPQFSVAGFGNADKVHGLLHHHDIVPRFSDATGWWFVATEKGARSLNRMRAKTGLTPVRAGREFPAYIPHDSEFSDAGCPEPLTADDGDALAAIAAKFAEASALEGTLAWTEGALLIEARDIIARRVEGKREAAQRFADFFVDELHIDKSTVTRRITFASVLPSDCADLGAVKGYEVARAVRDGLMKRDEAVNLGRLLSVSDFRAALKGDTPADDAPCCPTCGRKMKKGAE